jgi:hypothetical protein
LRSEDVRNDVGQLLEQGAFDAIAQIDADKDIDRFRQR